MGRVIKFRAWEKENKMFITWDNFMNNRGLGNGGWMMRAFENETYVFQQYTGLKDKNGVEIFEGDIYKKNDNIYVVIFDGLGFKCKKTYNSWLNKNVYNRNEISLLSEIDSGYCYEVIGNIHEHSHLIEGTE